MAVGEKGLSQPFVDAAWEIAKRLEEALPYVEAPELERDIDLALEEFKFTAAMGEK
jgi:hypothetical protein